MRRIQRKRPGDYLTPFLVIVGLGIVGALGFQLLRGLQANYGDVFFYINTGKARVLNYGSKEWEDAYSGTKLLLGDSLKTAKNGRITLQFFNGSIVRMGEDSEVTLTDLSKSSNSEKIALTLSHGVIWLNKAKSEGVGRSVAEVRTAHALATDVGTIFEVSANGQVETIRVLRGNIRVNVLDADSGKDQVLDTVYVGVGQEINLDAAVLKAFRRRQTPSVLMALSDQFRASEWYSWNIQEDKNLTNVVRSGQPVSTQTVSQQSATEKSLADTQKAIQTQELTQQKTSFSQELGSALQKNSSSRQTRTQQQETALSQQKTQRQTVSQTKVKNNEFSVPMGSQMSQSQQKTSLSQQVVKEVLTVPTVKTFNGGKSSVSDWGVVKVEGEVYGAAKVVINGFALTKFKPGSTKWIYYANENGGNLKPGSNEYEAYAMDANGQESARAKFTITYNKREKSTQGAKSSSNTQQKTQQTQ